MRLKRKACPGIAWWFLILASLLGPGSLGAEEGKQATPAEGAALYEARKYDEAAAVFEGILKREPGNAEAHAQLGRAYLPLRHFDDALTHAEESVKLSPKNANYQDWLGDAYVQKGMNMGMLKGGRTILKSKDAWRRAVEIDPSLLEARYKLSMYYLQAPRIAGGSRGKAREQAEAFLKIDGGVPYGHLILGMLAQKDKNSSEAESHYKHAIEGNDSRDIKLRAINTYGYFLLDEHRYVQAIDAFLENVKLAPEEAFFHYALGHAYDIAGRNAEAISAYQDALKIDPDLGRGVCRFSLAESYEKSGGKAEAVSEYKEYIRRHPRGDKMKEAEKKLKGLGR